MPLFVIFLIFPFAELFALVMMSHQIGFWATLGLCVLAAISGSALIQYQGFSSFLSMQRKIDRHALPLDRLFDGFCIVLAGLLLICPGFISDMIAIALLVPTIRNFLRTFIRAHTQWSVVREQEYSYDSGALEGEYTRVDNEDDLLPGR